MASNLFGKQRMLLTAVCAVLGAAASAQTLSLGGFHGLQLSRNTTVAFGETSAGQGDVPPSLVGTSLAVAAGGFHSCALYMQPGASYTNITCWGSSGSGATSMPPVVAFDGGLRAIAAGGYHSCAILSNSSLVCWGSNSMGQAVPNPPVQYPAVKSVALGAYHSCLVASPVASPVVCWGRDAEGQVSGLPPHLVLGTGSGTRVTCGGYHCCAWGMVPSTPVCWGASKAGQASVPAAVSAAGSSLTDMCAGGYFSCALVGGSVTCWGSNTKGETNVPPTAQDGGVVSLACGWHGACAQKQPCGSLVCWGGPFEAAAPGPSGSTTAASLSTMDVAGSGPVSSASIAIASGAVAASAMAPGAGSGGVSVLSGGVSSGAGSSGGVLLASGSVAAGTSGIISVTTGSSLGGSSGAVVISSGGAATSGARGSISLLAPATYVDGALIVPAMNTTTLSAPGVASTSGTITIGGVSVTEAELRALLNLLPSASPSMSATPTGTPSMTGSSTTSASRSPTASLSPTMSASGSATAAATKSVSSSTSPSASRSASPSTTGTSSVTPSASVTSTSSISVSVTGSVSVSASITSTASATPSLTPSPSVSATVTPTGSITPTRTSSMTASFTPTLPIVSTLDLRDTAGMPLTLNGPADVAFGDSGLVYITELGAHRVRQLVLSTGIVTTVAGSPTGVAGSANGVGTAATFTNPRCVVYDATRGRLYVSESPTVHRIRAIQLSNSSVTTLAGGTTPGTANSNTFNTPHGLALVPGDSALLIVDSGNTAIRRFDLTTNTLTTLWPFTSNWAPMTRVALETVAGTLYVAVANPYLGSFNFVNPTSGSITTMSQLTNAQGMAMGPDRSLLWVSDASSNCIRLYSLPFVQLAGTIGVCGGIGPRDGPSTTAVFTGPMGLAFNPAAPRVLLVADYASNLIRQVLL